MSVLKYRVVTHLKVATLAGGDLHCRGHRVCSVLAAEDGSCWAREAATQRERQPDEQRINYNLSW